MDSDPHGFRLNEPLDSFQQQKYILNWQFFATAKFKAQISKFIRKFLIILYFSGLNKVKWVQAKLWTPAGTLKFKLQIEIIWCFRE